MRKKISLNEAIGKKLIHSTQTNLDYLLLIFEDSYVILHSFGYFGETEIGEDMSQIGEFIFKDEMDKYELEKSR